MQINASLSCDNENVAFTVLYNYDYNESRSLIIKVHTALKYLPF